MFKDLFNLKLKRTFLQAIGFYLAFTLLGLLIAGILGVLPGIIMGGDPQLIISIAMRVGHLFSVIYVVVLSFLILKQKHLFTFGYTLFSLVAVTIAIFSGLSFSLGLVAFLTTRENRLPIIESKTTPDLGGGDS